MSVTKFPRYYRSGDAVICPNCGRYRVQGPDSGMHADGVCEKCTWDVDGGDYATITRPPAQCVECHGDIYPLFGRCDNWLSCSLARMPPD
jgi:hypothetical protein